MLLSRLSWLIVVISLVSWQLINLLVQAVKLLKYYYFYHMTCFQWIYNHNKLDICFWYKIYLALNPTPPTPSLWYSWHKQLLGLWVHSVVLTFSQGQWPVCFAHHLNMANKVICSNSFENHSVGWGVIEWTHNTVMWPLSLWCDLDIESRSTTHMVCTLS